MRLQDINSYDLSWQSVRDEVDPCCTLCVYIHDELYITLGCTCDQGDSRLSSILRFHRSHENGKK